MDLCNIYNCISVKFVFLLSGDLVISFVRGWLFSDLLIRTELPSKDTIDQLFCILYLQEQESVRHACRASDFISFIFQVFCNDICGSKYHAIGIPYIFMLSVKVSSSIFTRGSNSHCTSIFSSWNASTAGVKMLLDNSWYSGSSKSTICYALYTSWCPKSKSLSIANLIAFLLGTPDGPAGTQSGVPTTSQHGIRAFSSCFYRCFWCSTTCPGRSLTISH